MKIYSIERKMILPTDLETAWEFFSTPLNLNKITPTDMSFEIFTPLEGVKMYPGMIINYKVRPFLNIPLRWTTEITHCEEGKYFVDEQRFGPYAFWHHQHHFKAVANGVEMTDIVHYAIGFGLVGAFANSVYVQSRLESIFDYRSQVVNTFFEKK